MALTEACHGRKLEAALPYLLGAAGKSAELGDWPIHGQGGLRGVGSNTGPEGRSIAVPGMTSELPE